MDKRTEEILNKVYNLILDTDIHKNERDILLHYKTRLENTKNEQRVIMELAEALRQQAVSGIHSHKSMSPKVATFYKEIATYGQLSKNIAQGLISFSITR
jgi:hypothetical protein